MRCSREPLALLLLVLLGLGCGTRYARVTLVDDDATRVILRSELRDGAPVARGYQHPATIAAVRLAHILSLVDVKIEKSDEEERRAAVPTDLLYPLGEQLSAALAKADATQEVAIEAVRRERRLGLFTQSYATTFVAFVDAQGRLQLHFSRADWLVPKGEEDAALEPFVGREVTSFRVAPAAGLEVLGRQAVAVDWRDPRFRTPANVHVGAGGRVHRREVLSETDAPPPAAEEEAAPAALPTDPATLRALAELEEARKAGRISEGDYQRRRRELLAAPAD
jgi:hypothetical protein